MSTERKSGVRELAACTVDLFDVRLGSLGAVIASPDAQKRVKTPCRHCGVELDTIAINAPFVACDSCIQKHTDAEKWERYRKYWEREDVCPKRYRETYTTFKDFPATVYAELKEAVISSPNQSLFLYGPTGACKTRMAFLLLKQHLIKHGRRVGVLWPEKLRSLVQGFETTAFDHYAAYDVLLMDDVLLTAVRESKLVDAVKQLVDVRMRHDRPFIITSQIGSEDDLKDGKEFGEVKTADVERIKALLRRLREDCRVVPFAKAEAKDGESAF